MNKEDLNYAFLYYKCKYVATGDIELVSNDDEVCFGRIFDNLEHVDTENKVSERYIVEFYHYLKQEEQMCNNMCFFTKNEILEYLLDLQDICRFSFLIDDTDNGYKVTIDINDYAIVHKFVLTLVRYVYEHPSCFFLKDALYLKHNGYDDVNIINILSMVFFTNRKRLPYNAGHSIFHEDLLTEFITREKFQAKALLENMNECRLLNIFDIIDINEANEKFITLKSLVKKSFTKLVQWDDDFHIRERAYIKNLNDFLANYGEE